MERVQNLDKYLQKRLSEAVKELHKTIMEQVALTVKQSLFDPRIPLISSVLKKGRNRSV